ncbi:transglycosylase SLT domain-containing protein [Zavarzinia compransoris]|uniref:lytic transglycosylase domain-containing protein n=1 Tax=Zavarzinia marina TaxID=2911065 RepID=UPI001F4186C9|nr:lytic transglycosylase domain-containing protein [Zavarzinia marina]MCF4165481.1 transglycosylase SLT domain-containing protein [Zavarzinia marina]
MGIARYRIGRAALAVALTAGLSGVMTAAPVANPTAEAASQYPSLLGAGDRAIYQRAFARARQGDWEGAATIAAAARDRTLARMIEWQTYQSRSANASFENITYFVQRTPGWPRLETMLSRAEAAIDARTPVAAQLAWFSKYPPVSGLGKLRYGAALLTTGEKARGLLLLRQGWVEADMPSATESEILSRYQSHLTTVDHVARLQRLLMDRDASEARRMLALVPSDYRAAGTAAVAYLMRSSSADKAYAAVPAARRNDPGLLYARIRYLRVLDHDDQAVNLIAAMPPGTTALDPEAWWTNLRYAGQRLIDDGRYADAYRVVRAHGLGDGVDYFDAEWMAGWIALRFLGQADVALRHFTALTTKVETPISSSRATYWAGRAAAARGDMQAAQAWYGRAAVHSQTFYGQLAAYALGETMARPLPVDPPISAQDRASAEALEMYRLVRMLIEIDEAGRIRPFVRAAMDAAPTPGARAHIAEMAAATGGTHAGVIAAKSAIYAGTVLVNRAYPILSMPNGQLTERALALALTRQESEFRADAVSPAGARGLMQLMPGTAKLVARSLGMRFEQTKLTSDPRYNMTLGVAHLDELLGDFGGSYAMVIGAYNAGGGRIDRWINRYGDPRSSSVDVVDWVERIPFGETRNYVQRVLENTQVYRLRLNGNKPVPMGIARDLLRGAGARTTPVVDSAHRASIN